MNQNNLAIQKVNEKLKEGTLSIFEKARYKEYLGAVSKFPQYSANNQTLIYIQDKNATMVCGYDEWKKKHKRHVVKGGKGMKILAPRKKTVKKEKLDANGNPVLDKNGNPVMESYQKFIGFCIKTVFDVSQTAGEPIPSITTLFSGNVDGYTEVLDTLCSVSPTPVLFKEEAAGYTKGASEIVVKNDIPEQKVIQLLIPSVAGAILEQQGCEICDYDSLEAESVAYIVATHFGINADYDFDYISDWCSEKDLADLTASLKSIHKASTFMIGEIEKCRKANLA